MKKFKRFLVSSILASIMIFPSTALGAVNDVKQEEDIEFINILTQLEEDLEDKIEVGLTRKKSKINDFNLSQESGNLTINRSNFSSKDLNVMDTSVKMIQEKPELVKYTRAYKALNDEEEFNKLFDGISLSAGENEADEATYLFEDGSSLSISLTTERIPLITLSDVTTIRDGAGYKSVYDVTISHLWVKNARLGTVAQWYNYTNPTYAHVFDTESYVDISPGNGSSRSGINKNDANPASVRGIFELTMPSYMTVTRETALKLYPGTIPLATGEVVR